MADSQASQGNDAARTNHDPEASVVCGGVALAASRRVLRSFRFEVWWAFLAQAVVGISTMVMGVVLLCFMVHRVAEGHDGFALPKGQWTAAFALITVHLFFQPLALALLLMVPCRSRPRLHRTAWWLTSTNFQLDINAFIQIMLWRLNEYGTCEFLDKGAVDMSCSDAQGTGTATAVLVFLFQGALDMWYFSLLQRARPMSADPVLREVLAEEAQPWRARSRVLNWLLAEGKSTGSWCRMSEPTPAPPEVSYEHKRTDIELAERRPDPEPSRRGSEATLPPYQPRDDTTIMAADEIHVDKSRSSYIGPPRW